MKLRRTTSLGLLSLASLLVLSLYSFHNRSVVADAPNIIINELHYHPSSENDLDDFLELYNTTPDPVNISGWCFEGITLCFQSGTILSGHSYGLVSKDFTHTQGGTGISTIGTYTGNLSNGGETITLKNGPVISGQVVDSVAYMDGTPWPATPDGSGPSLELKDSGLDNDQPTSWAASLAAGGTPGAQNSVFNVPLPELNLTTKPSNVNPSGTPLVVAQADNVDGVELFYRVGFEPEQQVSMLDDGAHGDGSALDGAYGVSLPVAAAGELVRYRVVATSGSDTVSVPRADDSIDYEGYVVSDSVSSQAPIIRWFVSDEAYADILDNPMEDDSYRKSVIEYDGKVYDNTDFRLKGEYSRSFPKKGFKFRLPSGYTINLAGGSDREIDEFHMNSNWQDGTSAITSTAWWLAEESGMSVPDISPIRVQKNNQFEGVYIFAEKYEKEWREENNVNTGNIYEDFWEKKQGPTSNDPQADRADMEEWKVDMNAFNDEAKRDYILDNNNIPSILTYTSIIALLRSNDHTMNTNTFAYHDTEGTGRWSLWLWDLDLLFSGSSLSYITPHDIDSYLDINDRFSTTAPYQQEDIREMYYRRLRTLVDKFYSTNALKDKYISEAAKYAPDMQLDVAKWPGDIVYDDPQWGDFYRPRLPVEYYTSMIETQKANLLYRYRLDWAIPEAQKQEDEEQIYIEEVGIDSGNDGNEYIKISNNSNEYVDISDWHIDGIDYDIPAGSVVPAGGSVYLVKNDVAFRALHNPVFVMGQYSTSLSIAGPNELMLKSNSNQEIDSYVIAE